MMWEFNIITPNIQKHPKWTSKYSIFLNVNFTSITLPLYNFLHNAIIVHILTLTDILPAEAQIADKTGLWSLKRTKAHTQKTFSPRGKKTQLEGLANTLYIIQHTCILSRFTPASQLNVENFLLEINSLSFHIVHWSLSLYNVLPELQFPGYMQY